VRSKPDSLKFGGDARLASVISQVSANIPDDTDADEAIAMAGGAADIEQRLMEMQVCIHRWYVRLC